LLNVYNEATLLEYPYRSGNASANTSKDWDSNNP
jgi:hypothetical protein